MCCGVCFRFYNVLFFNYLPSGASRARTGDPLLAKQVLSQLSYGPRGGNVANGYSGRYPVGQ